MGTADFGIVDRTDAYSSQLAEELLSIKEDQDFCDFQIRCGNHIIPCHRILLDANSVVLSRMLSAGMEGTHIKEVDLSHISKTVLKHLLDYMYSGEVNVPADLLIRTIDACEYLQMLTLKEKCLNEAPMFFTTENALSWHELADRLNLQLLKVQCQQFIATNFVEISKKQEFLNLSFENLLDCLKVASSTKVRGAYILHEALLILTQAMRDPDSDHQRAQRAWQQVKLFLDLKRDDLLDEALDTTDDWLTTDPQSRPAELVQDHIVKYKESAITVVTSDALLDAAIAWIKHDVIHRSIHILQLLSKVNLQHVSLQHIQHHLNCNATLLGLDNAYTLLENEIAPFDIRKVLMIAGGSYIKYFHDHFNDFCWYITPSNQFRALCKKPIDCAEKEYSICKTPKGFALTGGYRSNVGAVFDIAEKSWSQLPKMLDERWRHASICINGLLYVVGGKAQCCEDMNTYECDCEEYNVLSSVHILNMNDNTWQEGPSLPVATGYPEVAAIGSSIYLLNRDDCQLFELNTGTNTWQSRAALPAPPFPIEDPDYPEEDPDYPGGEQVNIEEEQQHEQQVEEDVEEENQAEEEDVGEENQAEEEEEEEEDEEEYEEENDVDASMISAGGKLFVAGSYKRLLAWYTPTTDTWCFGDRPHCPHSWGALSHVDGKLYLMGGADSGDVIEEYDMIDTQKWKISDFKMPFSNLILSCAI